MIILRKLKIAILLSLIIISFNNVVLSNAIEFKGKIHKNVYIRDIDLSGLTKNEAENKINEMLSNNESCILKLNNKEFIFSKEKIDVDYNVDELVKEAYDVGRSEGIISNLKVKANLNMGDKLILDYNITYNEKKLEEYIKYINKEIYKKPINSTIGVNNGNIIVTKEKYGYKLNENELRQVLISKIENIDKKDVIIPISYIKPHYLYSQLSQINSVLGRFETYFNPNNKNRSSNIKLASDANNNILLYPGERFSFNSNIEDAHIYKYLKEAPVIINGKSEKGIGGGMCQVSSTIYNAALYSGMKIINVKNHSIPSKYIEKGRDATVSRGCIDLKFSNKFNAPVFIYNEIDNNKIVSTIYGNEKDKMDIEVITEVTDIINNKVVRKNSEEYDFGQEIIEQQGRKGYKVKTYRVYKSKLDNKTEYIGESYYPPQDKVIIYGTRQERK